MRRPTAQWFVEPKQKLLEAISQVMTVDKAMKPHLRALFDVFCGSPPQACATLALEITQLLKSQPDETKYGRVAGMFQAASWLCRPL
eukprot:4098324-Amphidinium_carterae.1